jgi:hypothetical protein
MTQDTTLSRGMREGGYTFLKRALTEHLKSGKPVVLNVGKAYLQYSFSAAHSTFLDGVTVLDGADTRAVAAFNATAKAYDVKRGLDEITSEVMRRDMGVLPRS